MKTYIVSFGNSKKYRINLCCEHSPRLHDVKEEVKEYLRHKFPTLDADGFYDTMSVEEVPAGKEAEYAGYSEFGPDSIEEIKQVLSTEVKDDEAVQQLNRNAPFDSL